MLAFYEDLVGHGKPKKLALVTAMHKVQVWARLASQKHSADSPLVRTRSAGGLACLAPLARDHGCPPAIGC